MAAFHDLTVVDIHRETRDAVSITLKPREEDKALFEFVQGQYLTFRHDFDGEELRRSYSICSSIDDDLLRIGVKRVDGGAFSSWMNEHLKTGDIVEAMPPMGRFNLPLQPALARRYLCVAAGSGITPVLSIIKTLLAREPHAEVTLVYSNRQVNSIMFREEIEDLKNLNFGRFTVLHIMTSNAGEDNLFTGRIDKAKCDALFAHWINPADIDAAFICGPEEMMLQVAQSLRGHGLTDGQIKFELFAASQPGRAKTRANKATEAGNSTVTKVAITLDGSTSQFETSKDQQSLLDAALDNNIDAPFACRAGVCSTCRAKVIDGEYELAVNHALEEYELKQGYVLMCQCYPLGDSIAVSYDQ